MSDPILSTSPERILRLGPREADELLTALERSVPVRPAFVTLPDDGPERAIVFGDTHGDWRSTEALLRGFEPGETSRLLVGLGDYIDRVPRDCGAGSIANALFLLSLEARLPERVLLVKGNHETARRIGVRPHDLPAEIEQLWGPEGDRYVRIMELLERGPIAATTRSGVYLAHAGFPRRLPPRPWTRVFDGFDDSVLAEVAWAECAASRNRRGVAPPWAEADLDRFLGTTGLAMVVRGHDPDIAGRSLYGDRVLTLHTTRYFQQYGGVLTCEVPLRGVVRSTADVVVRHLPIEGQSFPRP